MQPGGVQMADGSGANGGTGEPNVGLIAVSVGRPAVLGHRRGEPVLSGFAKRPVPAGELVLSLLNLAGDGQADLVNHGGPDKAVYAYPGEHLAPWSAELGLSLGPGAFGENLTTDGWLEDAVRIGDEWAWGDARLLVAQPRQPCYKLAMRHGRPDLPARLTASGRCGWYLRVLTPGTVPTAGPITVVARHPAAVTVRDAHLAMLPGAAASAIEPVLAVDALADSWRRQLAKRLAGKAAAS
jgi:MOSC domain-containing protein YiiM